MNQPARAISKAEEEGGLKLPIMGALARSVATSDLFEDLDDLSRDYGMERIAKIFQVSSPSRRYAGRFTKKQHKRFENSMPWLLPWQKIVF